jgi:hypothetical protein
VSKRPTTLCQRHCICAVLLTKRKGPRALTHFIADSHVDAAIRLCPCFIAALASHNHCPISRPHTLLYAHNLERDLAALPCLLAKRQGNVIRNCNKLAQEISYSVMENVSPQKPKEAHFPWHYACSEKGQNRGATTAGSS